MGYEEIVPPIPGREQEIHALNNLQKSWLNQPYYKYYMNESLRAPKIAFSENLNSVYRHLAFNFIVSVVALAPLALFARRFFITRSGIPMTYVYHNFLYRPDAFGKVRTDNQIRQMSRVKTVVPLHLISSFILATIWTDWNPVTDINYQFVHKQPKIM